jgi:hypothetical protein
MEVQKPVVIHPEPSQPPTPPKEPSSLVEFLGTAENGMALVHPPSKDDEVVEILRRINQMLQERQVKKDLEKAILEDSDSSVRRIQGGRLEIFLDADKKKTTAFDTILGKRLPKNAKQKVLQFAREQARLDPRVGSNYQFGNFSLIVTFDKCEAQAPHIDLVQPNFQFGLIVSEGSPGTLFYETPEHVRTPEELAKRWEDMAKSIGEDYPYPTEMPPALMEALRKDEGARTLLDYFGDVLIPERQVLDRMLSRESLRTGSLLSLPGSVLHAGPRADEFRAVVFFSAWQIGSDIAEYDPDIQYTGVMLAGHLLSILWRRDNIGYKERHYLLQRLVQYVEGSTVRGMWGHFGAGQLANFVGNIEEKTYVKYVSKEQYIESVAKSLTMSVPGDPFSEPDAIDIRHFQLISVHNLFTTWDGEECRVLVYRRVTDGKVILRYPTEGDDNPDEYEGHRPNENFQLIMKRGAKMKDFDGANGELYDTDGEEVKCFRR